MGMIGRYARKYGVVILVVCVLATIPAAMAARGVEFDTDFSSIFSPDEPAVVNFRYFSENFGITDLLVLVPKEDDPDLAGRMNALVGRMSGSGYFARVEVHAPRGGFKKPLVFAYPLKPSTDQDFCRAMLADTRRHIEALDLPMEWTGAPPVLIEANDAIWRDVRRSGAVAMGLLLLILVLTMGDPLLPLMAMVPLAMGVIWTMAFAHLFRGRVSMMAAGLPTALLGIGVDYTLHLRAGRREFLGGDPVLVWEGVFRRIGPPLFVGAATTATAFLALLLADLEGFHDLGVLGCVGLTACFGFTILIMPLLSDLRDRAGLFFRTFSMNWLVDLTHAVVQHRGFVIGVFVAVTLALLVCATGMELEMDHGAYEDPSLPAIKAREELVRKMGQGIQPMLLATPDVKAERRVVKEVRRFMTEDGPFKIVDSLTQQFDYLRKRPDIRRYLGKDGRLCMILFPRGLTFEKENLERQVAAVKEIVAGCGGDIVAYAGGAILYYDMMTLLRGDMVRTAVGAGVIVILVLLLLVRRGRYLLASVSPLVGGLIWMLGMLRLLGYNFSISNGVAMPLIIGLGIDYGVHIVHRLRHGTIETAMTTTGRAILVSALTTAGAFLALSAAGNRALVAMGVAAGIGILSCLIWSLFFLPALLGRRGGE